MTSNNSPLYPILQRRSSSSSSSRLNTNHAVEDLDSAIGGLSLSIMSMDSNNSPQYRILQRISSSSSSSSRLNTNHAVEDLDSAMGGLSLSTMSQGNSLAATASNVDPHDAILTHPTMEEVSSEYGNNHHVFNNYNSNNNTVAVVQGAPLASSHDFLSIMSQGNSVAASSVDPHDAILTHPTMEEVSSEYGNNHHVFNNYNSNNNNTGAIVQGAPLASNHDFYYGFSRIEQETNDYDVGESSGSQTLEGIRGHVATLAMDQCGCRFLQMIIDSGTPQEVEMILDEVIDHTHELMTHHFGNYLIEKIFTSRNLTTHQMERILSSVTMDQQQLMITNHSESDESAVELCRTLLVVRALDLAEDSPSKKIT